MAGGLDSLTFEEKQTLLRLVVERIVVEGGKVRVEAIIPVDDESAKVPALRPPSRHSRIDGNLHLRPPTCIGQGRIVMPGSIGIAQAPRV